MAKGYTTSAKVADYLGRTFTAAQVALATSLVDAVEAWIDRRQGRGWSGPAVVDEYHPVYGDTVRTSLAPVVSLEAVRLSPGGGGELVTGASLRDASSGLIDLGGVLDQAYVYLSYTPANTVPAHVALAATMLVAYLLRPALHPDSQGLSEYQLGQELRVKLRDEAIPADILDLLGPRRGVGFA